jgi:predicted transport protein
VREEYKKLYIAYKNTTNFVDIEPQKKRLRLNLNMDFDEIKDPESKCKDVTDLGTWGNGNVEFSVFENKDIDYAMFLIEQSYHKHAELNGD